MFLFFVFLYAEDVLLYTGEIFIWFSVRFVFL